MKCLTKKRKQSRLLTYVAPFVRLITKKAYEAGAKIVHVVWNDDELTRLTFDMAPDEAFLEYPEWLAKGYEQMAKEGAAFLSITASNPDLLKGVHPDRIANRQRVAGHKMATFRNYIQSDKVSWCVIAAPSKEWAEKVFPDAKEDEQEQLLWEAIFKAVRADQENPVEAWCRHDENLRRKVEFLNNKKYKALHYKAPGTDLTIELHKKHIWIGGSGPNKKGINGTVASTKPLSYGGNIINNFTLTFKNGCIVDFAAEEGYETLKRLIETDEGSHYLGEIALVPHDSPISQSNILFYNTLFDENASCHLAIGNAEELKQCGANESITHVDFMIGSAELNIDGILPDDTRKPLFRNGNWAIK